MSKKRLNAEDVRNELSGQSVFFHKHEPTKRKTERSNKPAIVHSTIQTNENNANKKPSSTDTVKPRDHDTTVSRYHATSIETVRKAVKVIGKEAATHRFTLSEKQAINDLVYAYKRQGIRTSENEIARIAINFILIDHSECGENSVIDRVMKALRE